jgi:hypothetical protein
MLREFSGFQRTFKRETLEPDLVPVALKTFLRQPIAVQRQAKQNPRAVAGAAGSGLRGWTYAGDLPDVSNYCWRCR